MEYDLRITQRLIVQPRLELNAAGSDIPELGLGSGLSSTELGIRLRYEFKREFAPYIGVSWEKLYGDTADFSRLGSEPTSVTSLVMGIRAWFWAIATAMRNKKQFHRVRSRSDAI
ncbi:MAG: copper resistance protein B [Woeseiaceae bacterium]|nr:copper resistance protein B [Woeseiaceae bacterium]